VSRGGKTEIAEVKTVLDFVSRVAQPRFLTPRDRDAAALNLLALLAFRDSLRGAIPNQTREVVLRGNESTSSLAL
jgi:hypothetical protein